MAWTSADLTAIETAIANGQLTVEFRDRKVTYRSLEELTRIRAMIREDLGSSDSFADRARFAKTKKDLS